MPTTVNIALHNTVPVLAQTGKNFGVVQMPGKPVALPADVSVDGNTSIALGAATYYKVKLPQAAAAGVYVAAGPSDLNLATGQGDWLDPGDLKVQRRGPTDTHLWICEAGHTPA
jgi:hypothetical protein